MLTAADHRLFAYACEHESVFSLADAAAAGLREPQIRYRVAHFWTRLHDGVFRMPGAAPSWMGDLRAAILVAGKGAAISHRSGSALYDLPDGRRDVVELTCPHWDRTKREGLVVHESRRMGPEDIRDVHGIPTTSAELLILQLAARRRSPDYVEMMIHAARRKRLITYESTLSTFNRHAGRGLAGTRAVRIALERWDPTQPPSDSEMETMLLQTIRAHGLPDPVIQFEVRNALGNFVRRVDAAYPDARLAIEYDSKQEHSDEFQIDRDNGRRNALSAVGYRTIAARHRDLMNGGRELCTLIAAALKPTGADISD